MILTRPAPSSANDVGDGLAVALAAARRLADATTVDLLCYDADTGYTVAIGGDAYNAQTAPCREVQAAIRKAQGLPVAEPSRWVDTPEGERLLVKVKNGPAGSVFILLNLGAPAPADRDRMSGVVRDLAVLIGFHIALDRQLVDMAELQEAHTEALDHGECGVIAVRADHSVVFANSAATAHLVSENGLRLRRGSLRPADNGSAIRFEAAFNGVVGAQRASPTARPRANVLLLPGKSIGAAPVIVVIAPAGGAGQRSGRGRGAAAIIYLLPAAPGNVRGLETLCRLHGLTRVESRLIGHLMEGRTLTEAAAAMRIKSETVRAYVKQIFAKTGLHRQTDLITMMARYQRAVRGDFDFHPA